MTSVESAKLEKSEALHSDGGLYDEMAEIPFVAGVDAGAARATSVAGRKL
jgi:hypothetical protein